MFHIAIPIAGAVVLGTLGVLRFLKVSKTKNAAAQVAAPTAPAFVSPAAKAASAQLIPVAPVTPVDVSPPITIEFLDDTAGQEAVVTTKDAPPSGDLRILDAPNGRQIGAAEKNGIVTVLRDIDGTFSEIAWEGGPRLSGAQGFAKKQFLKLLPFGQKVSKADRALIAARSAMQANPTAENIAAATAAAIEAEPLARVQQTFTGEGRRKHRR